MNSLQSNREHYFVLGFLLLVVIFLTVFKISSHDFWFELKGGELFVQQPTIHNKDIYTFTVPQKEWVNAEWGSEVIYYLIYSMSGFTGVIIFKSFLAIIIFYVLFRICRNRGVATYITCWILFVALFIMRFRLTERPQMFSFLFITIFFYILDQYRSSKRNSLWILTALMVVWTNIHFESIMGVFLIGFYSIAYTIYYFFPQIQRHSNDLITKTKLKHLLVILTCSILATFINPSGISLYKFLFEVKKLSDQFRIIECVSPINLNYTFLLFPFFWIHSALSLILVLLTIKKINLFDLFYYILSLLLGFSAVRFIAEYSLISAPIIAQQSMYIATRIRENLKSNMRNVLKFISMILISCVVWFVIKLNNHPSNRFEFGFGVDQVTFPLEALDFLKHNQIDENIFNDITYGGQIIWATHPKNKIFIYGRYTVVGKEIFELYNSLVEDASRWEEIFDSYHINVVFVGTKLASRSALLYKISQSHQWKLVYIDNQIIIYLRNIEKFKEIINENSYSISVKSKNI